MSKRCRRAGLCVTSATILQSLCATTESAPPKDARILARTRNAWHAMESVVQQLTCAMGQRSIARRHFTAARRFGDEAESRTSRRHLTVASALTPALVLVNQILTRYDERISALEVAYSECLARFAQLRDGLREQAGRNRDLADDLECIFASQCSPEGAEGSGAADGGSTDHTAKLKAKAAQRRELGALEARIAEQLERSMQQGQVVPRSVAAVSDDAVDPVTAVPAAEDPALDPVVAPGTLHPNQMREESSPLDLDTLHSGSGNCASESDAQGVALPARKRARPRGWIDSGMPLSQIDRVNGAAGVAVAAAAAEPREAAGGSSPSLELTPSPHASSSLSSM